MDIIEIAEQEIETFDRPAAQTSLLLIDEIKTLRAKLAAMESQEPALRINSMGGAMQWNPNYKGDWSGVFYAKPMPADKPAVAVPDGWKEIVEAVAHIGIDFGYGAFVLSQEHINKARELLATAPSRSQQYSLSDALADMRATMRYIDEGEPDLDVIRGEIGEMILRLTLKYGCGGPEPDRCPSHESEQSNNWIAYEANKAKEQTKDWPEWKKDSVINSDAYAINQQTEGE